MLAYSYTDPEFSADPDMLLTRTIIVQEIIAQISGEENSLTALRGLLALIHGFVSLEINGQLRRGGDLSVTFDETLRAYLRGWQ